MLRVIKDCNCEKGGKVRRELRGILIYGDVS